MSDNPQNNVPKRKKRSHNSTSRKRCRNKTKREAGEEYTGFSVRGGKIKQDTVRMARKMGPLCTSKLCKKSKFRHCDKFDEDVRNTIFQSFWHELSSWQSRKIFVQILVKRIPIKHSRALGTTRKQTLQYFLYLNGDKIQVCRTFFLSTLGLKRDMVYGWVMKTAGVIYQLNNHLKTKKVRKRNIYQVARKMRLTLFLRGMDKMESHYCRQNSSKEYIAATFRSKAELYDEYKKYCLDNGYGPTVSYFLFSEVFDSENLALFKPRKDQCDTCVGYKAGQVTKAEYDVHVERQKRAKAEKDFDKKAAIEYGRHVFTGDTQAVKLSPDILASAIYFKTRLQVHNYTVYNLLTHQCTNYWWNETQGDLSSSSFVSCLIEHLRRHCLSDSFPITIYSDGCGYQNRNQFLSNALSNFAVKYNKIIEQKWLEKGHTQMECDSAHAKIEKIVKCSSIFVPYDYVDATLKARKTVKIDNLVKECPFDAEYLSYDFFKNYADPLILRFNSIRPGKKPHDPTVNQLRAMIYLPSGRIMYKIDFNEEYRDLPRQIIPYNGGTHEPKQLHGDSLKITASKYKHLQQLKAVIPTKYHSFYDGLKHQ